MNCIYIISALTYNTVGGGGVLKSLEQNPCQQGQHGIFICSCIPVPWEMCLVVASAKNNLGQWLQVPREMGVSWLAVDLSGVHQ